MGWLHRLRQLATPQQPALEDPVVFFSEEACDGTCVVQIRPWVVSRPVQERPKLGLGSSLKRLLPKQQGGHEPAATQSVLDVSDLPGPAVDQIWCSLDCDSKRTVRLVSREYRAVWGRSVARLSTRRRSGEGGRHPPPLFEGLSTIHLAAGPSSLQDPQQLVDLLVRAQALHHVRALVADHGLRGVPFQHLARFLVACPTITRLHLPHQRFTTATEQRQLTTVLETLTQLEELDLGTGVEAATPGRLQPTVLRRIARLKQLRVLVCDASAAEDVALFRALPRLRKLHLRLTATPSSTAALLASLRQLEDVQLLGSSLSSAAVEGLVGLSGLQRLDLASCPNISGNVLEQVVAHTSLTHLGLPCSLGDAELALLSKLPHLVCLRTCRPLTLPLPGVPCQPLTRVTQLVTSSMEFRGVGAGKVFPALQQLVVRRLGPEEAAAVKGCQQLREVTGQDASLLPDRGLAVLGQLPQLEVLEVHEAAQVTDEGFRLLCQRPLTALRQLSLGGFPVITDAAFLHLTASCRGLTSIALKGCPGLTDKTLARIAGCQQVTSVTLKRCGRGVTEQGVVTLVNGLRVTRVEVSGCPMVHLARRPAGRAAVHLTVDGKVL